MGIKAHLMSLGATVRDKFTNDVSCVRLLEIYDCAGFVFFAMSE
jgi:hypothetical protein